MHDSLCAIKRTLESGSVVPGGGAVETALSIYLENFATTLVRLIPPSTFETNGSLTNVAGLARTTRDSRVCQRPPRHPKDARRERGQGLDRARREAASVPQRGPKRRRWRPETRTAILRTRLEQGGGEG